MNADQGLNHRGHREEPYWTATRESRNNLTRAPVVSLGAHLDILLFAVLGHIACVEENRFSSLFVSFVHFCKSHSPFFAVFFCHPTL